MTQSLPCGCKVIDGKADRSGCTQTFRIPGKDHGTSKNGFDYFKTHPYFSQQDRAVLANIEAENERLRATNLNARKRWAHVAKTYLKFHTCTAENRHGDDCKCGERIGALIESGNDGVMEIHTGEKKEK